MSRKRARRTAVRPSEVKRAVRPPRNPRRAMLTDQIAAPASTPTDLAQMLDREWFRSHPYRSHRLRRAILGEVPGVTAQSYVVVRQVMPGIRMRCYFKTIGPLPSDEAPEHIAHAMYDLIMTFPGSVLPLQEVFQRSRAYEIAADPEDPSHDMPRYRH
jgi:hypothetical protein